jgi:hypothetical protein
MMQAFENRMRETNCIASSPEESQSLYSPKPFWLYDITQVFIKGCLIECRRMKSVTAKGFRDKGSRYDWSFAVQKTFVYLYLSVDTKSKKSIYNIKKEQ